MFTISPLKFADSQRGAGRRLRREPRRDGRRQGHRVLLPLRAPSGAIHGKGEIGHGKAVVRSCRVEANGTF